MLDVACFIIQGQYGVGVPSPLAGVVQLLLQLLFTQTYHVAFTFFTMSSASPLMDDTHLSSTVQVQYLYIVRRRLRPSNNKVRSGQ